MHQEEIMAGADKRYTVIVYAVIIAALMVFL